MKNYNMILTEKLQQYQHILQVKNSYLLIKAVIEKAKFTYSLLGKAFEKQIKTTEIQGEKQKKALEEYRKQLAESNALVRKHE